MRNFLEEKPWYFALCVLSFILEPILESLVMLFVDEEMIKSFLSKSFTLSTILPFALFFFTFFVCTFIYIYQQNKAKSKIVSSDELTNLKNLLTSSVEENEYVESMQAFQYTIKNDQNKKYIKLNYLTGAANEQIEINTILQTYFYFSYSFYKKMSKVSNQYIAYLNENDPIKKNDEKTKFLELGNDLCQQILQTLNSIKTEDEIKEYHCDMYRVLARIFPTIAEKPIERFLKNGKIELSLIKRKKTGILGAIVINSLYVFKNENSLTKNRIYFVFPYNNKKNIVFLGSINGACFPSSDPIVIDDYCKTVVSNLCIK